VGWAYHQRVRARVDTQTCQSSGNCLQKAPAVFEWDDDHVARAKEGAQGLATGRLAEIARNCPAMAIVLVDDAGKEIDPFEVE
jgi:ferredoxin